MESGAMGRHWREECAVVGIFNCCNAARLAYYSLFAMQHRGQEASGISVSDGHTISTVKGMGLVTTVFSQEKIESMEGDSAVGHNRYATAGRDSSKDSQPMFMKFGLGEISVAHNGNIVNAKEIRESMGKKGRVFQSSMDTEVINHLIADSTSEQLIGKIMESVEVLDGSFSLVILSSNKLFAMRDRYGVRPLSIGRYENPNGTMGYTVASESCAFDLIGSEYVRDVEPGELVVFEKNQHNETKLTSVRVFDNRNKPCVFEYIYFARPDSIVFERSVYAVRKNLGKQLAREHKIDADVVMPVPDSGMAAAIGYSEESKISMEIGLVRNHYVGRTFIEPTQKFREIKVKLKLNPIRDIIDGKKVIVIDDSIVRGTTSRSIVGLLRGAGAKEVHLLISSPPIISPCFYGVDTPTKEELISAMKTNEEIRDFIGADTVEFLSLEGLAYAVDKRKYSFCQACFDENYLHKI